MPCLSMDGNDIPSALRVRNEVFKTMFRAKFPKWSYGLLAFTGCFVVFILTIAIVERRPLWALIIEFLVGAFGLAWMFLLILRSHCILGEDMLLCRETFSTKKIPYESIKGAELYELPTGVKWYGRLHDSSVGRFYAMWGGSKDGVMIEADEKVIYGGKLFISPKGREEFVERLREMIE